MSLVPPNKVDTRTTLTDEYLAALRGQTDHGDRLNEAATDDSREEFRDTIAEELRGLSATTPPRAYSSRYSHSYSLVQLKTACLSTPGQKISTNACSTV